MSMRQDTRCTDRGLMGILARSLGGRGDARRQAAHGPCRRSLFPALTVPQEPSRTELAAVAQMLAVKRLTPPVQPSQMLDARCPMPEASSARGRPEAQRRAARSGSRHRGSRIDGASSSVSLTLARVHHGPCERASPEPVDSPLAAGRIQANPRLWTTPPTTHTFCGGKTVSPPSESAFAASPIQTVPSSHASSRRRLEPTSLAMRCYHASTMVPSSLCSIAPAGDEDQPWHGKFGPSRPSAVPRSQLHGAGLGPLPSAVLSPPPRPLAPRPSSILGVLGRPGPQYWYSPKRCPLRISRPLAVGAPCPHCCNPAIVAPLRTSRSGSHHAARQFGVPGLTELDQSWAQVDMVKRTARAAEVATAVFGLQQSGSVTDMPRMPPASMWQHMLQCEASPISAGSSMCSTHCETCRPPA
ncbi:uncharacterized protein BDZ99DRAFT_472376 [Mytilinidion resinicola]|uniref:Uncharacterized protein n=1 Tax=Mytilinidion resinicola TaxID=574789 RepID=A0A6A6Z1I0_9PEZI|nr:uncharacterized protein BDZ99DRAFT_472376 [Mytilinidion resinicola]KAF2815022.1 hypothetical protein BDZ99DRAFT_472376 [Mytilinidion resinicola]